MCVAARWIEGKGGRKREGDVAAGVRRVANPPSVEPRGSVTGQRSGPRPVWVAEGLPPQSNLAQPPPPPPPSPCPTPPHPRAPDPEALPPFRGVRPLPLRRPTRAAPSCVVQEVPACEVLEDAAKVEVG